MNEIETKNEKNYVKQLNNLIDCVLFFPSLSSWSFLFLNLELANDNQ
jgi:hypothetical protein